MMSEEIKIKGGQLFITENADAIYEITSGDALIYIVPKEKDGSYGRRLFVYEAENAEKIPALSYADMDDNNWRFAIVAIDETSIKEYADLNNEEEKSAFAKKIGLKNYEMEGFEEGLVEWYRFQILKEDGFIHKTGQEQKQIYESGLNLIYNLFNKLPKKTIEKAKNNMIYDATNFLCKKAKIGIAGFDKIKESCVSDVTIEDIARISHFICRKIVLEENWYKKDLGPILVYSNDETKIYACIPTKSGYMMYDPTTEKKEIVTFEKARGMSFRGYMCYRPFPNKKLNLIDLIKFGLESINKRDIARMLIMTLVGSLIGLLVPTLNQQLYDTYIPIGASNALIQMCLVIFAFMIGNVAFAIVKNLSSFRVTSRITYDVQSATYDRLFNLPESFFRKYDSGDLAGRVIGVGGLINSIIGMLLSSLFTIIFAIVYISKMISYSPFLTIICAIMIAAYVTFSVLMTLKTIKYEKECMELGGKTDAVLYQLIGGISKIRIAGVEDRALLEYLRPYIKLREHGIRSDKIELLISSISIAIESLFSVILYVLMVKGNIGLSLGSFLAFNTAFGSFASSIMSLAETAVSINQIKPAYERIESIMEALPELDDTKELPGELSGEIDISNVNFAYDESIGNVLTGINIHIKPGEYVGLVGSSGCGKSTLLKLLLGFEKPSSGKIYYDGRDIESIDKRELRKKFGVVLQDGKLISGSIYENITITAPNATYDDVTQTIGDVGLADDIAEMPMGLHTVLSEDCGTISGGQQQRILIARAIVGKPKILFFDEATSALDNITQSMVCESLEKLNATRLVIAHRLSTIMNCDRIIVLDKGQVVEEGSYEQLLEKKGLFYNLAQRQLV